MRDARTRWLAASGMVLAGLLACASPQGPSSAAPVERELTPEARADAAFMRGRLLELEGKLDEAAKFYRRAAEFDPESGELQRYLSRVEARMGNVEEAIQHGQRALELDPGDESALFLLGQLYSTTQSS